MTRAGDIVLWFLLPVSFLTAAVAPSRAQPFDLETAIDSPTWWTLKPDLSPEALQSALTDPASIRRRHEFSVQAGRAQAAPTSAYGALVFFVDPQRNPELVSMPLAYILFSNNECLLLSEEAVVKRLVKAGLSEKGASTVAKSCRASADRNRELAEANRDGWAELQALQKKWFAEYGETKESQQRFHEALRSKEVNSFRRISGKSDGEISEYLEVASENPPIKVATEALPALKASVSEADWARLRRYFLDWSRGLGIIMDVQTWKY